MSARQWKPGDVAWRTTTSGGVGGDGPALVVSSCPVDGHDRRPHWHYFDGGWDGLGNLTFSRFRPLVVIDPEDREQVERLSSAISGVGSIATDRLQAALRSLTADRKPEEPTARWSIVVDRDEDEWVRVLGPDFTDGWVRAGALPSNGKWTHYSDIAAVKVLSEGVTP